jgi:hypothetical protein
MAHDAEVMVCARGMGRQALPATCIPDLLMVSCSDTNKASAGGPVAHTTALVETLKRELRARNITYAAVAQHLGMSEVSVKRMFSRREFTLSRLDRICELAHLEFSDLARLFTARESVISRLTAEQEAEFVENPRLMLVALCVLNQWSYEQIVGMYDITPSDCIRLLARLDRLKFIELLPNNRYRLIVSQAFEWLPDGPIQRLFKSQLQSDFFRSRFDRENELLLLANGTISASSAHALLARIRKVASDFAEMRSADARLPVADRVPMTVLLGGRPWEPELLRRYRRSVPGHSTRSTKR